MLLGQIGSQVISLAVIGTLYRLVDTAEFGIFGMLLPLLLLAEMLGSLGLNIAAVQKREIDQQTLSTLFWLNASFSLVAGGVIGLGGLGCSLVYRTPALQPLSLALAGLPLVASAGRIHRAVLERKLALAPLTLARLIAQLGGGLAAVLVAWRGGQVWALVAQQYGEFSLLALGLWVAEPWRPGMWRRGSGVGALVRFGGYYSLSSLLFFAAQNADKVILSWLLGASQAGRAAVGIYTQTLALALKPVHLVCTPVTGIMLPALSRAHSEPSLFGRLAVDFYRMLGIVLFPCGAGLWSVADELMATLGGPAWAPAGPVLRALALLVFAQGLVNIAGSVFSAAGRADRLLFGAGVIALVLIQAYLAGQWLGGRFAGPTYGPVLGVAWAQSLAMVLVILVPYTAYCFASCGISPVPLLRALLPALLAAAVMGGVVFLVNVLLVKALPAAPARLPALVAVGVLSYCVLARREIRWLKDHLWGSAIR